MYNLKKYTFEWVKTPTDIRPMAVFCFPSFRSFFFFPVKTTTFALPICFSKWAQQGSAVLENNVHNFLASVKTKRTSAPASALYDLSIFLEIIVNLVSSQWFLRPCFRHYSFKCHSRWNWVKIKKFCSTFYCNHYTDKTLHNVKCGLVQI